MIEDGTLDLIPFRCPRRHGITYFPHYYKPFVFVGPGGVEHDINEFMIEGTTWVQEFLTRRKHEYKGD